MFGQGARGLGGNISVPDIIEQQPLREKGRATASTQKVPMLRRATTALQVPELSCFITDGVPGFQMAIVDYVFVGELRLLAAVSRSCVAISRTTLKARTTWQLADYVGLDFKLLCLILPQLRNLHTLHLDAATLLPPCASRGRLKLARAMVAQLVWRNASTLRHVVIVENCYRGVDDLHADFIRELQPAAGNLHSLYTETTETTEEFTAFLSSARMLTSLSVPNLLSIHLFCDSRRRHCPVMPQLEHLTVKYVSCPDLQLLGETANPLDVVLTRFPCLKLLEEFALNRCSSNSELHEFARKKGVAVRRAPSSPTWASALCNQLESRSKLLLDDPLPSGDLLPVEDVFDEEEEIFFEEAISH